jgi:hypothetical protein
LWPLLPLDLLVEMLGEVRVVFTVIFLFTELKAVAQMSQC